MVKTPPHDEGKVGRVERDTGKSAELVKKIFEQRQETPVVRRETPERGKEPQKQDGFKMDDSVPRFLRSVQNKLEGSWVFQTFRLPGTNYIVRDLRGEGGAENEALRKAEEFKMREGKLEEAKKKPYVNYLGERSVLQPDMKRGEEAEMSRILSEFEKLLIERFERGKVVEVKSEDGKAHYREKSDEEWSSFFQTFIKRSVLRKKDLNSIQKYIYRGLVSLKKGEGRFSVMIGDIECTAGLEKFTRLKVLSDLIRAVEGLEPGTPISSETLRGALPSEELNYMALAHKHDDARYGRSKAESRGMFGSLKTEEDVRERLGLQKGYKGPIRWEGNKGEGFIPTEIGKKRPVKRRNYKPFMIGAAIFFFLALLLIIFAALV